MIDSAAIGKRIQEKRKAKGLTQEQLGTSVGVTAQAFSRWENGDSAPDLGVIPDLCGVLDVTSDGLLGLSDEPCIVGEFVDDQGRRHKIVEGVPVGLTCTFCGKHQSEVERLIAGPGVGICNGCVDLCKRILGGKE